MKVFHYFLFITILFSCNNPNAENKILKTASPNSKVYKSELIRILKTSQPKNFTYTFREYKTIGNQEYIVIDIKGSNLKAESVLLVSNWNNISGIKAKKGLGYRGAELKNVKIKISSDVEAPFELEQVDGLID